MLLESLLITLVGLPVCGALAIGSAAFLAQAWLAGEPLRRGDWAGALIFGGFSFVVVALALRANVRVRRERNEEDRYRWLAHVAPYLVVLGGIGGLLFVLRIGAERREGLRDEAVSYCLRVVDASEPADVQAKCFPIAVACIRAARAVEEDLVSGHFHPGPDQLPEVVCIRDQIAAMGYAVVKPRH